MRIVNREGRGPMTTSRRTADILIQSPEGNPIAVVEVKNIPNLTRNEAIQLRRNLADYGVPFQMPFFLLLSQDIGFLWKDSKYENLDSQPTYEFPMDRVVARYSSREPGERMYEAEFVFLVLRWLNNLATKQQNIGEEPEKSLAILGFIEAVRGADVLLEAEL